MHYITEDMANDIKNAILFTLKRTMMAYGATERDLNSRTGEVLLENRVNALFSAYCEDEGIYLILDDDEPPIPDDVDETNYDPYMGCDFFEVDECY